MRPYFPSAVLVVSAWMMTGCSYGDMSVHYKECSSNHPCPEGFICVEHPTSPTESQGRCFAPADAPPCEAPRFCNLDENWVEACQEDGFSTIIAEECDQLHCNPDTALCATACELWDDCATGTCDTGTGLCRPFPDCTEPGCEKFCCQEGNSCISEAACVPNPSDEAEVDDGVPDLNDCSAHDPGSGPNVCALGGQVYFFPMLSTEKTQGLKMVLHPAGDPEAIIGNEVEVELDDQVRGLYRFEDVPTDRAYDVEIQARTLPDSDDSTVTTVHAGITIRADKCVDGLFSRSLSAVRVSEYESYTTGSFPGVESHRSLVIGRVADCSRTSPKSLGNVTVGLAIPPVPPGRIFYFLADLQALVPDTEGTLTSTSTKGYYAAAGVPACRNQVGFSARQGTSPITLGSVSFIAAPGTAVIANLPPPAERLPD